MLKYLNYKDVALVPRHSSLVSRSNADVSVEFLGRKFGLPIIPANMLDVIDENIASYLSANDYFYIMHRFGPEPENGIISQKFIPTFVKTANENNWKLISISIGVSSGSIYTLKSIKENGYRIDFITVDVAHADNENVKDVIEYVKTNFPDTKLIVGNVATSEGCEYLIKLGVDAVKIGIGGGCFIPNSQIKTNIGVKNIQDIKIGEKVLTHNGEYKQVNNIFEFDRNEELITINNTITCTKNHEFYVIHKNDAQKVNETNLHEYAKWIKANNLTDEYFLIEM